MDLTTDRYNRNSGAVPFAGILLMIVAGVVVAVVLSLVYAAIAFYNPFVYFTGLATVGLGYLCGRTVTFAANKGHVRNKLFCYMVGGAVGLVALYFTWVSYIFIASGWQLILLDPSIYPGLLQAIAQEPLWTVRGSAPPEWGLYVIWLIEAGMIFGLAIISSAGVDIPYCESCRRWTGEGEAKAMLATAEVPALQAELEDERYESLAKLSRGQVEPNDHFRIRLFKCPGCAESNFLTVSHVVLVENKKGEQRVTTRDVIKHLRVPADVHDEFSALEYVPPTPPETLEESADEETESPVQAAAADVSRERHSGEDAAAHA